MKININDLRKVKGIGSKTLDRIKEQFDESDYVSGYDSSLHLEENSINHGDCLELMNGIPDKSVDMVLADLPYGQTQNKWDSVIDLDKLWKQYNRIIKDNGAIILFGQGMFTAELMQSNISMWKYNLIWDKVLPSGFLNANRMPLRNHEDIVVFYKNLPKYNPQKFKGKPNHSKGNMTSDVNNNYGDYDLVDNRDKLGNMKHPKSILKFSKPHPSVMTHPTEKSLELFKWLIKSYTDESMVVLDNVSGSGTTAVACMNTNRKYICIEKDKEYYDKSVERVNNLK